MKSLCLMEKRWPTDVGKRSGITMGVYPKFRRLGRQLELEVVATIFIIAASSFLFLKLVSEVREGETHAVDEAILLALRDPADPSNPIGPPWVEVMFRGFTSLGSPSVLSLVTVGAVGYLWLERERPTALFVVLAIAGGAALEILLKLGFARPRPELVSHLVDVNSFSFPSGHATMVTITYLTLGVLLARVQERRGMKLYVLAVATFLALLVGITRIYLGAHRPTDVLAGWCLGAAWALACWLIARPSAWRLCTTRRNGTMPACRMRSSSPRGATASMAQTIQASARPSPTAAFASR
jgi:undecaprenyl-diphosphatase